MVYLYYLYTQNGNYDWILFVASPMAFTGVRTHGDIKCLLGKRSNPYRP